jgi:hypothetical protein
MNSDKNKGEDKEACLNELFQDILVSFQNRLSVVPGRQVCLDAPSAA